VYQHKFAIHGAAAFSVILPAETWDVVSRDEIFPNSNSITLLNARKMLLYFF